MNQAPHLVHVLRGKGKLLRIGGFSCRRLRDGGRRGSCLGVGQVEVFLENALRKVLIHGLHERLAGWPNLEQVADGRNVANKP